MNKKVLIFTYYWPPAGGPGVQRFLKFSKHLSKYGWDPIIITPKDGSYPYKDESLLNDVDESVTVHHTSTTDPFKIYNALRGKKGKEVPVAMIGIKDSKSLFQQFSMWVRANFFIPDARIGWNKHAVKKAKEVIQANTIGAIITTGPPHSTHLIGKQLNKQFNIPWLADFRDPWNKIYYNQFLPRTEKSNAKDLRLETMVLETADCTTTVSEGLKLEFGDRAKNMHVLYNGFEEDDIPSPDKEVTEYFHLSYTGNMKPNQDLPMLWKAIKELCDENDVFKSHFKLSFTGIVEPKIVANMKRIGIHENVEINDFVAHHEATKIMVNSNLLLLPIPIASNNKLILTGKIFEYLASCSPILSIGPVDGNAAKILEKCERNVMIDYQNKDALKNSLSTAFDHWYNNDKKLQKHKGKAYMKYSRIALTEQLSALLNQI